MVLVDESAARGVSSDRSAGPILDNCSGVRCALAEPTVGSVLVVVLEVFAEELFALLVVPDERAVEELAADRADPSFRVRVRDRRVRRGTNDRRALAAEHLIERAGKLFGTVADQEPDPPLGMHHEVPGRLRSPHAGRIRGYAGAVHAAGLEFDEEQHVVATQQHRIDGEEVTRHDPCRLAAQERCP